MTHLSGPAARLQPEPDFWQELRRGFERREREQDNCALAGMWGVHRYLVRGLARRPARAVAAKSAARMFSRFCNTGRLRFKCN